MTLFRSLVFILMMLGTFAAFGRCHYETVIAIGCKYSMEACQVYSYLRNQCGQFGDKIQRLEDDVGGSVTIRCFELITDIARGRQ